MASGREESVAVPSDGGAEGTERHNGAFWLNLTTVTRSLQKS